MGGTGFDPLVTPYDDLALPFPHDEIPQEQFRFLLRFAAVAPSTHNSQPWRFRLNPDGIEVFADYRRRMPGIDPDNRELLLSVGCAITNLRIAARHFGLSCRVDYSLTGGSEDPIAMVHLTPAGSGRHGTHPELLFPFIGTRRTNRQPFMLSRVPQSLLRLLADVAAHTTTEVIVSDDGAVNRRVGEIVAEAERIQWGDVHFRKDTAAWVRADNSGERDGIQSAAFGWSGHVAVTDSRVEQTVHQGRVKAALDRNLCAEAPGLVLLACRDTVEEYLAAGEILGSVLLTAERTGLQTSYFNMPVQIPEYRDKLQMLLDCSGRPQVLLRVGFCSTVSPRTPRRPVDDLLIKG
jgi:hypothetical protein